MVKVVDIRLAHLREQSVARAQRWHRDNPWPPSTWAMATLGELGEAANVHKKMIRVTQETASVKDPALDTLGAQLAEELADTVCYADLWAHSLGQGELAIDERWGKSLLHHSLDEIFEQVMWDWMTANRVFSLCSHVANVCNLDLWGSIVAKFNAVSDREGFPEHLELNVGRSESEVDAKALAAEVLVAGVDRDQALYRIERKLDILLLGQMGQKRATEFARTLDRKHGGRLNL